MLIRFKSNSLLGFIKNHTAISLMILIMPFSGTTLLGSNLLGISGFKLLNIMSLSVLLLWLLKGGEITTFTHKVRAKASIIFFFYIIIFLVEFLRSYYNLNELALRSPNNFDKYLFSSSGYILTYLIKPLFMTFSFLYIINHIRTSVAIEGLVDLLLFSLLIFALFTLLVSTNVILSGQGRGLLKEALTNTFGFHYNAVGSILMLSIPLALSRAITRKGIWFITFIILAIALLFTQSRGSILGALAGIILYLYFQKRIDTSLFIIIILITLLGFSLSDYIVPLFTKGIQSGDLQEITSGRVSSMWVPLIVELLEDPSKMIFGFGLYGMVMSHSYMFTSGFFRATHAHNAYLNLLVDGGLIIFLPFVFLLFYSIKRSIKLLKSYNNPTFNALLSCLIVYLVASLTGRKFFPDTENMMLFPIIALLLAIVINKKLKSTDVKYKK